MKWRIRHIILRENRNSLPGWLVTAGRNCEYLLSASWKSTFKYFLDVFGHCSGKIFHDPRPCSKNRDKTRDCLKKYKFYLSFENALCEDYVTEKYWGNLGKKVNLFLSLVLSIFLFLDLFWRKMHQTAPIPQIPNNWNLLLSQTKRSFLLIMSQGYLH